jgi:hypothetical protein
VPKEKRRREHWKVEPEEHDFPAARDYLALLLSDSASAAAVESLRDAETIFRQAKDLVRASRLALLPANDPHVAQDLAKVARGQLLSPVLLVRGSPASGLTLIVADGYHRICASYHLDEDAKIPCRLVELP